MGEPVQIGRYVLHDAIASGGMAKIHLAHLTGAMGFARTVAVKRIHPHFLGEREFVEMFVDETRVAARIQHPNVVSTLDAVVTEEEVFLVLEYIHGDSLARLLRAARTRKEPVPVSVAVAILGGVLRGLHAAHEATSDRGEPLGVVHRDVSPQNIIVGADGVARVLDFGVAKARGRLQSTRDGQIKGKLSYMSPEQLRGEAPDRRTDIYATAVVLWEALAGQRLFTGDNDAIVYARVTDGAVDPPSLHCREIPPALDRIVLRALSRDVSLRPATAEEMVLEMESVVQPASPTRVGEWVKYLSGQHLMQRAARIAEIERGDWTSSLHVTESSPSMSSGSTSAPASRPRAEASNHGMGRSVKIEIEPPRKRTPVALLAVFGVLLTVGLALVMIVSVRTWLARGVKTAVAHEAPASSPSPSPPSASADPSQLPSDPTPAAPPIAATATAEPAAKHAPTASPKPHVTAKALPPDRAPATAPESRATQEKPSCNPPWVLDAKGIKRFKPECL